MQETAHEPQCIEWTGKDGTTIQGVVLADYKFYNARYVVGQVLRVGDKTLWGTDSNGVQAEVERCYFIAIDKGGVQTFMVSNEAELLCLSAALTGAVARVSAGWAERKEDKRRPA